LAAITAAWQHGDVVVKYGRGNLEGYREDASPFWQ
jgi:hypothetical protein